MPAIVIWKILGVQKEVINIFAIVKLIKNTIYPCPSSMESGWYDDNKQDRCTK